MKLRNSFHPYAFTTIVCWSISYILTKFALQHFSASALGFLRYLIASALLAVMAAATRMKLPKKRDLPWFFLAGGIGFFLYMVTFNEGQGRASAATGSVMIATAPVMTALLASIFYREKLRPCQWIAVFLEFAGVGVITLINGTFSVNSGLLLLFLAALSLSLYNLFQRKLTRDYTPLQVSTYSIFAGTLLLAVFLPGSFQQVAAAPAAQLVYLGILGVFSSALGYVTWAIAFARAEKTSQVSNYMFLTPFLASLSGFVLAGEVPDRATLLGGGIILTGVFLFNFGDAVLGRLLKREM